MQVLPRHASLAILFTSLHLQGRSIGDQACHFHVFVQPGNTYVSFESVKYPGYFIAIDPKGNLCDPKEMETLYPNAHFSVRAEFLRITSHSKVIMTQAGKNSIAVRIIFI